MTVLSLGPGFRSSSIFNIEMKLNEFELCNKKRIKNFAKKEIKAFDNYIGKKLLIIPDSASCRFCNWASVKVLSQCHSHRFYYE